MAERLGAIFVLLLAAALAGCREEGAVSTPPADGYYRLPLTDNPVSLDPARFTDVNSEGVARRVFNGLVRLDGELRPAPDLAESWRVSPDGLTYAFHLRRGVLFHNGRELTAQDVRYSFERLLRQETASPRAWVVEAIVGGREMRKGELDHLTGIETPDRYTVILLLREPFGPFLNLLAMGSACIVPQEEVEKAGAPFGRRPVGTGPFRFRAWRDNDSLELARHERYFEGPPALAGLRFRVIKEALVAWREYLAGNLEHCAVPEGYLDQVRQGPRAAELQSTNTLSTFYLGFAMTHDPCGMNVHLRRAINYAVDRAFLCEKLMGGSHTPAKGVLPPGLAAYNPALEGYRYDPARAQEELRLSGYGPGGKPLPPLTLYFNSRPPGPLAAQAVQEDLERIGIPLRVRSLDFAALLAAVNHGEPDLFRLSWSADFADADNFLYIFHSRLHGASGNRARFSHPEIDALLDRSRREPDAGKRAALLREAEQRIVEEAPWVFLSHGQTHLLVKPYVRHLRLTPMDVGTSVNQVDFRLVTLER